MPTEIKVHGVIINGVARDLVLSAYRLQVTDLDHGRRSWPFGLPSSLSAQWAFKDHLQLIEALDVHHLAPTLDDMQLTVHAF